ncbi:MAG TPA: cation:dicarboxylase symporter family transporter [Spirochaetia bacterium]|nr:cation:dicarboxylase symporter family transporter [Spirochaetia bacterium]
MKIWIKLLVGSIIGIVLGFVIPVTAQGFFDSLSGVLIGIGRYVLFPLVFFSLGIGTSELRQEKRLGRVYLSSLKYLALSAAALILIGTLSVLVFPPERIPITIEADRAFEPVSVLRGLRTIFPRNSFAVFTGSGDFLLPVMVLAFLLGVNLDFDRQLTRPIVQIFDSLSRIFYHLNSLIVELFAIAMIPITAAWISHLTHSDLGMYKQILIILAVDVGLVAFGVFPGALYLLGIKQNPYRWLYASIGPAIAGLFSGDQYLSLGVLTKHGKESLGVPRMVGSAVYPVFAVLGRAGTAMVSCVSFILILRSYSSLEITFFQALWVMLFTFLVSFVLGAVPGTAAYFSIFMLCTLYARGLQEGYLILRTIAPVLVAFGAFVDVLSSAFVSLLIAREEDVWTEVETESFI